MRLDGKAGTMTWIALGLQLAATFVLLMALRRMRSREAGSFDTRLFLVTQLLAILGASVAVFAWSGHEMSVIAIGEDRD